MEYGGEVQDKQGGRGISNQKQSIRIHAIVMRVLIRPDNCVKRIV